MPNPVQRRGERAPVPGVARSLHQLIRGGYPTGPGVDLVPVPILPLGGTMSERSTDEDEVTEYRESLIHATG